MSENGDKITSIPFPPELFCAPDHYKALWLAIKAHCLKRPSCFVGYPRLATIIRHNERHVRRTARAMEKDGWLKIENRIGKPHTLTPLIPRTSTPWGNLLTPDIQTPGPETPGLHAPGDTPNQGPEPNIHTQGVQTPGLQARTSRVQDPGHVRPPNIKEEHKNKNKNVATPKKTDPRIRIVKDKWAELYPQFRDGNDYAWTNGKDEIAAKKIATLGKLQEGETLTNDHPISKRMRICLGDEFSDWGTRAPAERTLSFLASHWNRWDKDFPSNAKPKTIEEPKDKIDHHFDRITADYQKLPPNQKQVVCAQAQGILHKNLPKAINPSSVAAKNMLELCELAIYCELYDLKKPKACQGVKT